MERRRFLRMLGLAPAAAVVAAPALLTAPEAAALPVVAPPPASVPLGPTDYSGLFADPEGWARDEALRVIQECRRRGPPPPDVVISDVDLEAMWNAVSPLRARAVGDDGRVEYP